MLSRAFRFESAMKSRRLILVFGVWANMHNATPGQALVLAICAPEHRMENAFHQEGVDRNAELKRIQEKYGLNEFGLVIWLLTTAKRLQNQSGLALP